MNEKKYNATLCFIMFVVICLVGAKLAVTADATDNWRGFGYSFFHVLIVSLGAYLAIRKKVS